MSLVHVDGGIYTIRSNDPVIRLGDDVTIVAFGDGRRRCATYLLWKITTMTMTTTVQPTLVPRADHALDGAPIHIGDIVHLRPADGSVIKARVIYNAPLNGATTYTTDLVTRMTESGRALKLRFRFRHEHVHGIEPVRPGHQYQAAVQ
jgi:hypothetical protein